MLTTNSSEDCYLTAEEIGSRLRINADTVLAWARRGRIPHVRISQKIIRFRLTDVVAALETPRDSETTEAGQ